MTGTAKVPAWLPPLQQGGGGAARGPHLPCQVRRQQAATSQHSVSTSASLGTKHGCDP